MFCNHKKIVTAVFELTLKCNARCIHCGSTAGSARENNLSYEEAVSAVKQLAEQGCKVLSLIGGEYFLYPQWRELLQEARATGMEVTIITNGALLNEEKVDFLKDVGLARLGFSIDGGNALTHNKIRQVENCFQKAFQMADYGIQKGLSIAAVTTLHKLNITELKQLRQLLLEHKFSLWQLQHASLFGRMKQELALNDFEYYVSGIFIAQTRRMYEKQMHIRGMHCMGYYSKVIPYHTENRFWLGCYAGKGVVGIRSDGKVLGCLSLYDDKYIEGDLREQPLAEILAKKSYCSWNNRLTRINNLKGYCNSCPYALACLGGCTSFNQEEAKCYYAIEQKMKHHAPQNPQEAMLKRLTMGKMAKDGTFYLDNNEPISPELIDASGLSEHDKQVLSLLIADKF
jgi:radical SAM protein with 4Fe4S-binding SPASM domain